MLPAIYRVSGWINRQDGHRPYWAQFGYYQSLEAAHTAARAVGGPARVISITVNGQTLATYVDGALIEGGIDGAALVAHLVKLPATSVQ